MKRITSLLLAIIMLFSFSTLHITASAASGASAEATLVEIQKQTGFIPGRTSAVVGNCYGFISAVCEKLYGVKYQEGLLGNGYQCKHATGLFYEAAKLEVTKDSNSANIESIINFFVTNALPGDVVHYASLSSGSTHTFMIQSIDSTKMTFFHSNYATKQYGSETCHVDTIYWDSYRKNPTESVYNGNTLYSHNSLFYNKMRYGGMGVTINRYTNYFSIFSALGNNIPVASAPTSDIKLKAKKHSSNSVKLVWNAVSGATAYQVDYKLAGASEYATVTQDYAGNSFVVSGLAKNKKYTFRVRPLVSGQWGEYSSEVTKKVKASAVASAKPSGLKYQRLSDTSIQVHWNKVKGAESYIVQYRVKNGKWKTVKNVTSPSCDIAKLTLGKYYQFRVRAVKSADVSKYSNILTAQALPPQPDKPVLSAAENGVIVTYTPHDYAGGYIIYRSEKKNGKYKAIATVNNNTDTAYADTTAVHGRKYYYKIACFKKKGKKKYTSFISLASKVKY